MLIARADFTVNNDRYYNNDGKRYQMRWYFKFSKYIPLMARAFDILQTMILVNIDSMKAQSETLKSYKRAGYLVNFDSAEGFRSFIVPYPGPPPINTGTRGGRRNKKSKYKKARSTRQKNKKNKNTRKNR
jgi:hypothetical protein